MRIRDLNVSIYTKQTRFVLNYKGVNGVGFW